MGNVKLASDTLKGIGKALSAVDKQLDDKGVYKAVEKASKKGLLKTKEGLFKVKELAVKEGKNVKFTYKYGDIIKKVEENPEMTCDNLTPEEIFLYGEYTLSLAGEKENLEKAFYLFEAAGIRGHMKAQEEAIKLKNRIEYFY